MLEPEALKVQLHPAISRLPSNGCNVVVIYLRMDSHFDFDIGGDGFIIMETLKGWRVIAMTL